MADDNNDEPSGAQDTTLGSSKDALFGWLVRRAAADLGLAEAIAASEAQRTEQIKRLEETLAAKIQQLKSRSVGATEAAQPVPGVVEDLKTQMEMLAARLGALESAARQSGQINESLKAELAAFGRRVGDDQTRWESCCSGIENTATAFGARVQELEQRLSAQPAAAEHFKSVIDELQRQMEGLAERTARLDSASPMPTAAERETERARWTAEVEERTVARIRELGDEIREKLKGMTSLKADLETGRSTTAALGERVAEVERGVRQFSTELKAEVSAQRMALATEQSRHQAGESFLKELDQRLGARLSDLENTVLQTSSVIDARLGEIAELRAQIHPLSERVVELARRAESDAAQAAQQARGQEETVAARLGAIAGQLNEQLRANESRGVELGHLRLEVRGLAERVGKAEFAAQQAQTQVAADGQQTEQMAHRLTADFTMLKTDIAERLKGVTTAQTLIQRLETTIGLKFQEFQDDLAQTRRGTEVGEEQFRDIDRNMQALARRLTEAETLANRTHALMVNESEQSAQFRDGLRVELDGLCGQLNPSLASDAEIRDIKSQVSSLSQGSSRTVAPPPIAGAPPLGLAVPVDINALRARREDLAVTSHPPEEKSVAVTSSTDLPGDAAQKGIFTGENKEQLRQLQERISADIERARAELREKSGRWKARR